MEMVQVLGPHKQESHMERQMGDVLDMKLRLG